MNRCGRCGTVFMSGGKNWDPSLYNQNIYAKTKEPTPNVQGYLDNANKTAKPFDPDSDISYTLQPACCTNLLSCAFTANAPIYYCPAFHDLFLSIDGKDIPVDIDNINSEPFRIYQKKHLTKALYLYEKLQNPDVCFLYADIDFDDLNLVINNDTDRRDRPLTVIFTGISSSVPESGHSVLIILDRNRKKIYYYEPNGVKQKKKYHSGSTYAKLVKEKMGLENYDIILFDKYKHQDNERDDDTDYTYGNVMTGNCTAWTTMFAAYSLLHYNHPNFSIQEDPFETCYYMFTNAIFSEKDHSHGIVVVFANVFMTWLLGKKVNHKQGLLSQQVVEKKQETISISMLPDQEYEDDFESLSIT